jgi:glycosyltransferase involved in cell wall biosynthesis
MFETEPAVQDAVLEQLVALDVDPGALVRCALRTTSPALSALVAAMAEVTGRVDWLAGAGEVLGAQATAVADRERATEMLLSSSWSGRLRPRARELLVDLLMDMGEVDALGRLRSEGAIEKLGVHRLALLDADLDNPFVPGSGTPAIDAERRWLDHVRRFTGEGAAVGLAPASDGENPFDRLRGAAPVEPLSGPLVSVVVSSFRPGSSLLTAVGSLIEQSWEDIEILVVDDASGPEFDSVYDAVARSDSRVKVIRQPRNAGTYVARNTAIDQASGTYITFQDSDDWSHPQRIAQQVAVLEAEPLVSSVVTKAVCASDALTFARQGHSPTLWAAPTLMFRREQVWKTLGGFDPVRKAADTEFHKRLEIAVPGETRRLDVPLLWMRMSAGSLSRDEIRNGWRHPSRIAYRTSYEAWHERIKRGASPRLDRENREFCAPRLYRIDRPAEPARFDLVVLGDWRADGPHERDAADLVRFLAASGRRVGLLDVEGVNIQGAPPDAYGPHARRLLAAGAADLVLWDEPVEAAASVVVRPHLLHYLAHNSTGLRTPVMAVLVDTLPVASRAGWSAYDPGEVARNAAERFGADLVWSPRGDLQLPDGLSATSVRLPYALPVEPMSRPLRSTGPVAYLVMGEETRALVDKAALAIEALVHAGLDLRVRVSASVVRVLQTTLDPDVVDSVLWLRRDDLQESVALATASDVVILAGSSRTANERLVAEARATGADVHVVAAASASAAPGPTPADVRDRQVGRLMAHLFPETSSEPVERPEAPEVPSVTQRVQHWYESLVAAAPRKE